MQSAPLPHDEDARLRSLRATRLLDSEPEEGFDEIVELASILCEMPMALVSLVDGDRQWFKARVGLDATETPREVAFCAHAILDPETTFEVPDATTDERFADNPLVTGAPDLRAYYGRPLVARDGYALGTLCVLDREPHELSEDQIRGLEILARQVEAQIELRRSRDDALSTAHAKSQFLATMSHEIRTPLHGMIGTLDLVLEDEVPGDLRDDLETALMAGRQLHGLLSSVLDISKADAEALELQQGSTDVRALARAIVSTFIGTARRKGVAIRYVVEEDVPELVVLDSMRMTQVLGNLVGNAVKFTDEGSIDLRVETTDAGRLRFEVRDTGRGITEADLPRIFERFEQAQNTSGGTGIGLSLAHDIVDLMGGDLRAESEFGVGSRFSFDIELVQAESAEPTERGEDGTLPHAKVLLVDDEAVNLRIGARVLEKMGLDVTTSDNGADALAWIKTGAFDAVLLDCFMVATDGFDVAAHARDVMGDDAPPIIALTASAVADIRERCLDVGMVDVLEKPIDREAMYATLARFLAPDGAR